MARTRKRGFANGVPVIVVGKGPGRTVKVRHAMYGSRTSVGPMWRVPARFVRPL